MRKSLFAFVAVASLVTGVSTLAAVPTRIAIEGAVTHVDSKSIEIDGVRYVPHPTIAGELASKVRVGDRVHVEVAPTAQGGVVQKIERVSH